MVNAPIYDPLHILSKLVWPSGKIFCHPFHPNRTVSNMKKAMKDADFPTLLSLVDRLQFAASEGVLSQDSVSDMIAAGR